MGTGRLTDAGWATADDWANHRSLIISLYRDQNKTLNETKRIMEDEHGFSATMRMYKARFQQWGIQKKIRADDAVEIARQQAARTAAGKSSVAYIGNFRVPEDRLRRYRYRANAKVSERILMEEKRLVSALTETQSASSRAFCRTPSPSPSPEDRPPLAPRLKDPTEFLVPLECMKILKSYIAGSVAAGVWQISTTAPVPDAFTWAHYLATSQGLYAHNRSNEGTLLLDICFAEYKSHLMNPDPFFWLATYKAALLLAERDVNLGSMFIRYASELTRTLLPPNHAFNRLWSLIDMTGLAGIQQHAKAVFESYLMSWEEQVGLLPPDQTTLVQMGFVLIQLQCSGMISYKFTKGAIESMMRVLSGSVDGQFLLQEAKFRMACLYLERNRLDEADLMTEEILTWIDSLPESDSKRFNHLRCKCLWTMFDTEQKRGNLEKVTRVGRILVDLCRATYGRAHLQTLDALSALENVHVMHNTADAQKVSEEFENCWVEFYRTARERGGFPHIIEQPWLHRCIELKEDEELIEQAIGLLTLDS